jgi:hypothetical protein
MIARLWLLLLRAYLLAWVPLNFALELATVLPSLRFRGPLAVLELTAHGVAAAISIAAGYAIWNDSEDGYRLAPPAVILSTAATIQALFWSALPHQTKPGDEWPLAMCWTLLALSWLLVLRRRARLSR